MITAASGAATAVAHAATTAAHAVDMVAWAWLSELVTLVRGRCRLLGLAVRVMLRALYRRRCQYVPAPARRTGPRQVRVCWRRRDCVLPAVRGPRAPPGPGAMWMVAAAATASQRCETPMGSAA